MRGSPAGSVGVSSSGAGGGFLAGRAVAAGRWPCCGWNHAWAVCGSLSLVLFLLHHCPPPRGRQATETDRQLLTLFKLLIALIK